MIESNLLLLQKISVFLIFVKFFECRPQKLPLDGKLVSIMTFVRQGISRQVVPQRLQVQRVVRLLRHRLRVRPRPVSTSRFVFRTSLLRVRVDFLRVGPSAVAVAVDVGDGESRFLVADGGMNGSTVGQRFLRFFFFHFFFLKNCSTLVLHFYLTNSLFTVSVFGERAVEKTEREQTEPNEENEKE